MVPTPEDGEKVVLHAAFTARPGHEDELTALMAGMATDVRAEPGNVVFEPYVERDRPAHWFVYEVYRDQAAFRAHIGAAYGAVFNARLNEVIEEDGSQLTFLRRAGPAGGELGPG